MSVFLELQYCEWKHSQLSSARHYVSPRGEREEGNENMHISLSEKKSAEQKPGENRIFASKDIDTQSVYQATGCWTSSCTV